MEKYSQFRDKGSGVAPFFPIKTKPRGFYLPVYVFFFIMKLPVIFIAVAYFLVLQWLPLGTLFKKAILWIILGMPGLWWIDLQIDGVRKGSLAKNYIGKVPGPSDIIASSFASPIDALYLAAIFDPVFTVSYPHTEKVRVVSLLGAFFQAFTHPEEHPPKDAKMTDFKSLISENQRRAIVVFPECSTTNGMGIMPFSPSLLTVPHTTKIFPLHLRYAPSDITTPIPKLYFSFLWNLLSTPTHSIRVRIAKAVYNDSAIYDGKQNDSLKSLSKKISDFESTKKIRQLKAQLYNQTDPLEEKNVLDSVGEALARLGRVPRVGLTVRDKINFIEAWK